VNDMVIERVYESMAFFGFDSGIWECMCCVVFIDDLEPVDWNCWVCM